MMFVNKEGGSSGSQDRAKPRFVIGCEADAHKLALFTTAWKRFDTVADFCCYRFRLCGSNADDVRRLPDLPWWFHYHH